MANKPVCVHYNIMVLVCTLFKIQLQGAATISPLCSYTNAVSLLYGYNNVACVCNVDV